MQVQVQVQVRVGGGRRDTVREWVMGDLREEAPTDERTGRKAHRQGY